MKKVIYFIIRYSVLLEKSRGWVISRQDFEDYKEQLFCRERLSIHYHLFKNVAFQSILNQKTNNDIEIKLIIVSSDELPQWNKELIESISKENNWVLIDYLPSKGSGIKDLSRLMIEDLNKYEDEVLYASLRMDDDDALSDDFVQEFSKYMDNSNVGKAISFGYGVCGFYDFQNEEFTNFTEFYGAKIAIGLGLINRYSNGKFEVPIHSIYQAGNHKLVDKKVVTILDSRKLMYIRTIYDHSDSYSQDSESKLLMKNEVETSDVKRRFNLPGIKN